MTELPLATGNKSITSFTQALNQKGTSITITSWLWLWLLVRLWTLGKKYMSDGTRKSYQPVSQLVIYLTVDDVTRMKGYFPKKPWCCISEYLNLASNKLILARLPPWRDNEAEVLSIRHSSEQISDKYQILVDSVTTSVGQPVEATTNNNNLFNP